MHDLCSLRCDNSVTNTNIAGGKEEMTNKIGKTSYPELVDFALDAEGKLIKFQYVDWTTTRTIYVPEDIDAEGVFYHAGCRYELPRYLELDRKLYARTTYNNYKEWREVR